MTHRRLRTTLVLTAACAALLSGCGALPGEEGASEDPVVVMTWAPEGTNATNMPGMPAMAEAFAKYVNAEGGLDGRELKVLTCNEHNDTIAATRCAGRAADEGAVAVIGSYSQFGDSFMSALETFGIPYIGGYGISQDEFDSPLSYPVNGGVPALLAGNGEQLAPHCEKVSLVRPDTTVGDQFPIYLNAGLKAGGRGGTADLRAADDATSYADVARRATGDGTPGRCVTALLGDRTEQFFDSFRRLDKETVGNVRLASVLGSVTQSLVNRSGGRNGSLEGSYVTGWYPVSSDPRWDTMKAVVKKYAFDDDRIDVEDPGVQTTWIAYTVFRQIVAGMGADADITPLTVKSAMDNASGVRTGGLTPDLSWQHDDLVAVVDYPRMVNGKVIFQEVRNGRLVAAKSGFVDVTDVLERPTQR